MITKSVAPCIPNIAKVSDTSNIHKNDVGNDSGFKLCGAFMRDEGHW